MNLSRLQVTSPDHPRIYQSRDGNGVAYAVRDGRSRAGRTGPPPDRRGARRPGRRRRHPGALRAGDARRRRGRSGALPRPRWSRRLRLGLARDLPRPGRGPTRRRRPRRRAAACPVPARRPRHPHRDLRQPLPGPSQPRRPEPGAHRARRRGRGRVLGRRPVRRHSGPRHQAVGLRLRPARRLARAGRYALRLVRHARRPADDARRPGRARARGARARRPCRDGRPNVRGSTGSARPMRASWRSTTDVGAGPVGCSTARSMPSSRRSCNARSPIPPTLRARISSSSTSPTSRRVRRD